MAYLAPIHRSSSVRHALKIRFLDPEVESLVVGKANRLEIYTQDRDGLVLLHTRVLYGKITMLERFQPPQSSTEHLFVGTDRYMYFTLSWDIENQQLHTERSFVDQADKTARDSQTQDRCLIDPTNQFMALQLYDGIVTVLPLASKGKKKGPSETVTLGDPIPARIPEFFVRSSAFLYPRAEDSVYPRLAVLFENSRQKVCLSVKNLEYSPGGLGDSGTASLDDMKHLAREDLQSSASHLIPIPAPAYGLVVLSETCITYIDDANGESLEEPLRQASIFVAWARIDAQRYLLADDYGKIYLLMLLLDDTVVASWKLDVLGDVSRASVLTYMGSGIVFVGSHQGDSQLIKILDHEIEVLQTFSNIAPILDFTIMDMGNRGGEIQTNEYSSGQARIVTGSGAFQDGSLRSVRSGVGMEDQGVLGEMDHITQLFSLCSSSARGKVDLLAAAFVSETRIFQFQDNDEIEERREFAGLVLSERSLHISNISNQRLLQVTKSKAHILDLESGMVVAEWSVADGQNIIAATAHKDLLALSVGSSELVILDLNKDLEVSKRRLFSDEGQIACIHVSSLFPHICIVGFWESTCVAVLDVLTLETLHKVVMSEDVTSVPRAVLLTQLAPQLPPTLFIAMANGEVVTFSLDPQSHALSLRKATILGTQQASFKELPRSDGFFNVFAVCEHPSLLYSSEGRIVYAAVTAEGTTCVCPFDSNAFPEAIAVATEHDLRISLVDTERTTHIQTLMIKETVRRIAYSKSLKAFGMGTIHRELQSNYEAIQSHFKLVDEVLFKELDSYELHEEELVESCIRADLRDGSGEFVERFVVGTTLMEGLEPDGARGRIIVFAVTPERKLKIVAELSVKGACRTLGVVDGNIVAGLVKTVIVYSLQPPSFTKIASYRTSTAPISLAVSGNQIAISDLMKSVSVVTYRRPQHPGGPHTLIETARHFQTAWSTAVANIDESTWLESDAEGNLMVLRQNVTGVTADDQRRLQVVSSMRLGEMVNQIREVVNVEHSESAVVIPRAFLGTVDGSIYLFGRIAQSKQDLLMRLQQAVAARVQSPGHVPFNAYRAFKNSVKEEEEPFRFVDGELVERFLDCEAGVQESIVLEVGGGGLDVEEVRGMVEGLKRIH